MRIGVPKEIKVHEYRVGPRARGGARAGRAGPPGARRDQRGRRASASPTPTTARRRHDRRIGRGRVRGQRHDREGQGAAAAGVRKAADRARCCSRTCIWRADPEQAEALVKSGATCIAYETVTAPDGSLPLLTPMSEVAGRMSVQVGAYCLQKANGGRGVLLGGVPGVPPAKVVDARRRRFGHACGRDGGRAAGRRHGRRPLGPAPARAVVDLRRVAAHRVFHPGAGRCARASTRTS